MGSVASPYNSVNMAQVHLWNQQFNQGATLEQQNTAIVDFQCLDMLTFFKALRRNLTHYLMERYSNNWPSQARKMGSSILTPLGQDLLGITDMIIMQIIPITRLV